MRAGTDVWMRHGMRQLARDCLVLSRAAVAAATAVVTTMCRQQCLLLQEPTASRKRVLCCLHPSRRFQQEGVRKGLTFGGRCLVADEMGLGKTVQVRLASPSPLAGTAVTSASTWKLRRLRKLPCLVAGGRGKLACCCCPDALCLLWPYMSLLAGAVYRCLLPRGLAAAHHLPSNHEVGVAGGG